ncbi:MAG: glutaredoxin family protein [Cyanobacteriota bacterium]|jgi:hypothetical protein
MTPDFPPPLALILYSKPGCHLCEALAEKLAQVRDFTLDLEIRDITARADWLAAWEYEIPVLCWRSPQGEKILPRLSPRGSVAQLEHLLATHCGGG